MGVPPGRPWFNDFYLALRHDLDYISHDMGKKIGRNDPCPCGSGKKYKNCCGFDQGQGGFVQKPESWFPASEQTGTLLDDYLEVIPIVAMYGEKIMRFEEEGKELEKAVSEFEDHFRPGKEGGIMESIFVSWMYFDHRFGKSHQTVAERFLSDPMSAHLVEPGLTWIRQLSESYLTFHEILSYQPSSDMTSIRELGTGKTFTVLHVNELLEITPAPGEIWFARLVGTPDQSIFYTTPYIFEPYSRAQFKRAVKIQEQDFKSIPIAKNFPSHRHFAESQKEKAHFWVWYICRGEMNRLSQFERPTIVTKDGEKFVFAEIHFRIKDKARLRKRLSQLKSFEYDKQDDSWTWLTAKSRKYPDTPRSIIGRFRIKGNRFVAETNSKERAIRIRSKLKGHLRDLIAYEKTLFRDPYDFPELSPEEAKALEKESKELHARPEVQEAMKKHLEHHYFVEWPKTKLPALGNITPLQAAKRKKERAQLIALIDDIEQSQDSPYSEMPKINFNKLRKILGLPVKSLDEIKGS